MPLSRRTGPEPRRELEERGLLPESPIPRILAGNPVKPWRYQSWVTPRDPASEEKASVILDLCQEFGQGEPLSPGDRIPPASAKPSIQARGRVRAVVPAGPARR